MTAVQTLYVWLATIVFTMFPPDRMYPNDIGMQNSYIEHTNEVVQDITDIVYDPNHIPWFSGKWARAKESALVVIVASQESGGFNPDVEFGLKRGDSGNSWCLMQMNIGKGKTREGWTGQDLISDRRKCLTAGLNAMHQSMNACRDLGTLSGLSAYNTGRCIKNEKHSVSRLSKVSRHINKNLPTDLEVMSERQELYSYD